MNKRIFKKATKELRKAKDNAISMGLNGLISCYFAIYTSDPNCYFKSKKVEKRDKLLAKYKARIKTYEKILNIIKVHEIEVTRITWDGIEL